MNFPDSTDLLPCVDQYGYHVLQEYFDAETTFSLITAFEESSTSAAREPSAASAVRAKRGVVFALRNLLSHDFVRRFISSRPVQSLVDQFCPGATPVRAILFDKIGDANWTVPWHQDRSIAVNGRIDTPGFGPWSKKAGVVHVQPPLKILQQMVTLRISLDPCGIDNGPLRIIAGTHREILDESGLDEAVRHGRELPCTTSAGGMVVMRPLIVHASSPTKSGGHRRVLHIEFGPPNLPGGLEWAKV